MQAVIRDTDRAILETGESLAPRPGGQIVEMTAQQIAHWGMLVIPPGEEMALGEDGTIFVLTPAPPDPALEELRALARAHPDPLVRELARRAGILGGDA